MSGDESPQQLLARRRASSRLIGRSLPGRRYTCTQQIGLGGYAWVYKAIDSAFEQEVAIKVLLAQMGELPDVCTRFLQEAQLQRTLRHPHILEVLDLLQTDELVAIVLEWADAGDLSQLLGAPCTLDQSWSWIEPVLDAVDFAHQQGVIHRDIKPQNILLSTSPDGRLLPKIADFGVAKSLGLENQGLTQTGIHLGSLRYSSPEQIDDSKRVDHRSDIYSLGLLIYEALTGTFPFPLEPFQLLYHHCHKAPPPPRELRPELPQAVEDCVLRCLQKRPEDRFASARELRTALGLCIGQGGAAEIAELASALRSYTLSRWKIQERPELQFPGGALKAGYLHQWHLDSGVTMQLHMREELQVHLCLTLTSGLEVVVDLTPLPQPNPPRPHLSDLLWLSEILASWSTPSQELIPLDDPLHARLCLSPSRWTISFQTT